MKKFNIILLTASLFISMFVPVVSASSDYAEWTYTDAHNISGFALNGGTSSFAKKNNIYGIRAVPGKKDTVFVNVDDSFILDNIYTPVDIEVTYWDSSNGSFYLTYDAFDTEQFNAETKQTDTVVFAGTGEWVKKTFELRDSAFYNRCGGSDFTITAAGADDLIISCVRISEHYGEALVPMYMYVESEVPGNNFTLNDQAFDITLMSCDRTSDFKLVYSVLDRDGNVLKSDISRMNMAANERRRIKFNPNIVKYGLYTFRVEAVYKDKDLKTEVPFAVIHDGTNYQNPHFGAATHMELYSEPGNIMDLMRKAGFSGSRGGLGASWHSVEKLKKGSYVFPERTSTIIDMLSERNLEPCFSALGYNNGIYNGKDYLTCVTDAETLEGAKSYTAYMAENFKGRVNYYEDWNEFNSHTASQYSSKTEMAAEYVKLLKAKYEGIKSMDPAAKVVTMVTSMNDAEFIRNAFAAGAYEYSDIISIHPYIWGPYNRDVHLADIREICDIIAEYTPEGEEPLPLWFTEIGWATNTSGLYGVSEDKQAEYAVKMYIDTIGNNLADKIFWYDFINDGTDKADKEQCFGLINEENAKFPLSAKKSYVALAGMNSLLYDANIIDSMNYGDDIVIYRFQKTDGTQLLALWSDNKTQTVNLNLGAENITCYDMFSNVTKTAAGDNGCYSIEVSNEPCYITGNFSCFEKYFDADGVTVSIAQKNACTDADGAQLEIVIDNNGDRIDGTLTISAGSSETLVCENVTVPADGSIRKNVKLPPLAAGKYKIKAAYSVAENVCEAETELNINAENPNIPIITAENGMIKIAGTAEANKNIGVVIKSAADTVYIGQTKSDEQGNYEIHAKIPSNVFYYITVNDGAMNMLDYSDGVTIDFEVKRGETIIKNVSELCSGDTVTLHISVKDNGKIGDEGARLYCILNGKNSMKDIKTADIISNDSKDITFTVDKAEEIDNISILLWDKSMTPLKEKQQFK